jgi:hypothetical protein
MDQNRFDAITKLFGDRSLSRRQAMMKGAAALAAGALAGAGRAAQAQEATPKSGGEEGRKRPVMMFVQSFQNGSVAKTEGRDDRYTVTLEQGSGQTIYFSDRPDRIVGSTPTPQFLDGLGFPENNPPNAALIVETSPGETDIAVVELFNPVFDPESSGVTYDVEVLANWQQALEMEFSEAPTDLAEITPTFGAAQLFIDDCPDWPMACYLMGTQRVGDLGLQGNCWWWSLGWCAPCEPHDSQTYAETMAYWSARCNESFTECNGACLAASAWS